jgi:hypothetical protein
VSVRQHALVPDFSRKLENPLGRSQHSPGFDGVKSETKASRCTHSRQHSKHDVSKCRVDVTLIVRMNACEKLKGVFHVCDFVTHF